MKLVSNDIANILSLITHFYANYSNKYAEYLGLQVNEVS